MKTTFTATRAALWASAFLLLWVWFAGALERYDRALRIPMPPASNGLPLLAIGLAFAFWCIALFVLRGHGTPAPFDPPRRLVAASMLSTPPSKRIGTQMF